MGTQRRLTGPSKTGESVENAGNEVSGLIPARPSPAATSSSGVFCWTDVSWKSGIRISGGNGLFAS